MGFLACVRWAAGWEEGGARKQRDAGDASLKELAMLQEPKWVEAIRAREERGEALPDIVEVCGWRGGGAVVCNGGCPRLPKVAHERESPRNPNGWGGVRPPHAWGDPKCPQQLFAPAVKLGHSSGRSVSMLDPIDRPRPPPPTSPTSQKSLTFFPAHAKLCSSSSRSSQLLWWVLCGM